MCDFFNNYNFLLKEDLSRNIFLFCSENCSKIKGKKNCSKKSHLSLYYLEYLFGFSLGWYFFLRWKVLKCMTTKAGESWDNYEYLRDTSGFAARFTQAQKKEVTNCHKSYLQREGGQVWQTPCALHRKTNLTRSQHGGPCKCVISGTFSIWSCKNNTFDLAKDS